jgi:putative ABC transport system ATP-binding protein
MNTRFVTEHGVHLAGGQRRRKEESMSSRSKPPLATTPVIELRKVVKTYAGATQSFTALRGLDLCVRAGELLAVVGKSGSGKSTLLNLIAGIDRPSAGEVLVAGARVHELDEDRLATWRGRSVGIVFQFFQLLPTLTVAENVMLPMDLAGQGRPAQRRPRALALLDSVGIADQADKLPSALSGGQQQRAAIARALANDPPLIVADEPTGNLDSSSAAAVLALLADLAAAGRTVVLISHEREVAAIADRTITLRDGAIVDETPLPAVREERAHA